MPAIRTVFSNDFEDIPGDQTRLRCRPCSEANRTGQDTIIGKKSRYSHLNTKKHRDIVQKRSRSVDAPGPMPTARLADIQPAILSLATQFTEPDGDKDMLPVNQIYDPFSAGTISKDHREDLQTGIESLAYFDHNILGKMSFTASEMGLGNRVDATLTDVVEAMAAMGLDDFSEDEDIDAPLESTDPVEDANWAPHGSKTMFMLDLLDNLPRLRLSDDQLKAIIWVMRECGAHDVPAFSALRKKQAALTNDVNLKSRRHVSSLGNEFYMNHPADLIALDWSNPLVREFIHPYPEITSTISETWQAAKYVKEVDVDDLSPMWADWKASAHRHFYIKELAQLRNGQFVIPVKWIVFEKVDHAEVYRVIYHSESDTFTIDDQTLVRIPASDLKYNFLDLKKSYNIRFSDNSPPWSTQMPHPIRKIAKGLPVFTLRVMPWSDDVSGNVSKSYNAHMNVYIVNVNIPHTKLYQEYFVRFCSTSPDASSSEQFDALAEDFREGVFHSAYDCLLETEILFRILPHAGPADNPQQAETTSTAGAQANHSCRFDTNGGTSQHNETDDGYHAHFLPGTSRTPEQTLATIKEQIKTACLGVQTAVTNIQTTTGVKDKIAQHWIGQLISKAREMQKVRLSDTATKDDRLKDKNLKGKDRENVKEEIKLSIQEELFAWVIMQPSDRYDKLPPGSPDRSNLRPGDHYNVLLRVRSFDPHQDCPVEILHTVLLGTDKYLWHDTNKSWDAKKDQLFAARLQSSSVDGLSVAPIRAQYLVQYKNSLIGKQFKIIQQLAVFHLDDELCSPELFSLWKANGELGALIWYPEIRDMDTYLEDLEICLDNVLDLWAVVDPNRILTKFKLHVLPHIKENIRRFGPAVIFSTEIFECWNAVFRLCSVLSNHLAPSHDIAITLADMERFKHQVSGGFWKDGKSGEYVQAGKRVRGFMAANRELQRRLGWVDASAIVAGSIKLQPQSKQNPMTWREALGELWSADVDVFRGRGNWKHCKYLISRSHDVCKEGSWIFFEVTDDEASVSVVAGRLFKILAPESCSSCNIDEEALVIVEQFDVSERPDDRLNMPVLVSSSSRRVSIIHSRSVLFIFNAQHDCRGSGCSVDGVQPIRQGRNITMRLRQCVTHVASNRYIVNMHALHNAHLIRETLPRHLTLPRRYFPDRLAKHKEFAAQLRVTGPLKRAQTVAKSQATRAKNQAAKVSKATVGSGPPEGSGGMNV